MRRRALAAAAALALAATLAAAAPPPIEPYRSAASRGETGLVAVRAYTARAKPDAPDLPIPGVVATLLPYSDSLVGEIEQVKRHARDSMRAYRAAAGRLRGLEEAYEKAVWEAGAPELVRSSLLGPDGRFAFAGVPAGQWLLWARHEVLTPVTPKEPKKLDRQQFLLGPSISGYRTVRYWAMPVTLDAGGDVAVELTDRNAWFTGVVEETR